MRELLEDTLLSILKDDLGLSSKESKLLMKTISFSEYIKLKNLIDSGNDDEVKTILSDMLNENSYTTARQVMANRSGNTANTSNPQQPMQPQNVANTSTNQPVDFDKIKAGDKIDVIDKGQNKNVYVKTVNKLGDTHTVKTTDNQTVVQSDDDIFPVSQDMDKKSIQDELDKLKKLAGITPTNETSSAITSAAIAGAVKPLGELKWEHRIKKKPGPKLGSKNKK